MGKKITTIRDSEKRNFLIEFGFFTLITP